MTYVAYILECSDGTLYAGSTNDLARRLAEHNGTKRGARYTRSRRPVILRHAEEFATAREARQREAEIKTWTRGRKMELCAAHKRVHCGATEEGV